MEGLIAGILAKQGDVRSTLEGVTGSLSAPLDVSVRGGRRTDLAGAVRRLMLEQQAAPIYVALDLGEGITQRYRIERTREGRSRAVRLGGR
jgi:hypothetical protein